MHDIKSHSEVARRITFKIIPIEWCFGDIWGSQMEIYAKSSFQLEILNRNFYVCSQQIQVCELFYLEWNWLKILIPASKLGARI